MSHTSIDTMEWSNVKFNTPTAIVDLTTTDATPVLIASVPIPINTTYEIAVYLKAIKSDGATRNCGYQTGVFYRVAGDISQEGTYSKEMRGILTSAQLVFTLNQTSHEVEVYVKGNASTINWQGLSILIK